MPKLGVNIDHIATLRQQRRGKIPDLITAALICEQAGANGIVCHLREDRRHIQDNDVILLRKKIRTKLNLEMAVSEEIVKFALKIKPDSVCLVPERRQELTTEGGLDVVSQKKRLKEVIKRLQDKGIIVSLFIDPEKKQIEVSKEVGTDYVELHTGAYADAKTKIIQNKEFKKIKLVSQLVLRLGVGLNAGHGLDYDNVKPIAQIPGMYELNIGFSIISRAVFIGLPQAVKQMKQLVSLT